MSTKLKVATVASIAAVMLCGALAYSVHYRFSPAVIVLPEESVRMELIPISPAAVQQKDPACCNNTDRR